MIFFGCVIRYDRTSTTISPDYRNQGALANGERRRDHGGANGAFSGYTQFFRPSGMLMSTTGSDGLRHAWGSSEPAPARWDGRGNAPGIWPVADEIALALQLQDRALLQRSQVWVAQRRADSPAVRVDEGREVVLLLHLALGDEVPVLLQLQLHQVRHLAGEPRGCARVSILCAHERPWIAFGAKLWRVVKAVSTMAHVRKPRQLQLGSFHITARVELRTQTHNWRDGKRRRELR